MDSNPPSLSPTAAPTSLGLSTNGTLPDPVVEPGCGTSEDSSFDQQSWIIAVFLAVFAALINNLGVNLQKLAWTKKQSNSIRGTVYRTYWVFGMTLIVLASIFDFVALAFGPQSVIGPLGSLTMVANAFIAPWMHGEKLHPQVIKATVVIIIGCTLSVAAASRANNVCDVDSLFALYFTGRFALYIMVITGLVLGVMFFIRRAENLKEELGEESAEYQSVFRLHRISYSALSGIFGAQSVLFARTVDLLLVGSTRGGRIFLAYPGTYIVVFCLVGSIVLQIYWLNQGLSRFESLYNVPIFTCTWIVGTVLGGGVFYGEFSDFSWAQAVLFPLGIILCCVGVFFLAQGSDSDDQLAGLGDDEGDEEDGLGHKNNMDIEDEARENGDSRTVDLLGLPQKGAKKPLVFT